MDTLAAKVAAQRTAKAERAERLAKAHGASPAGRLYAAEAVAWRADAEAAAGGDTGSPAAFLRHSTRPLSDWE